MNMEELKFAINSQVDLLSDLIDKLRAEIKAGSRPAIDSFLGFFHAINWKLPRIFPRHKLEGAVVNIVTAFPHISPGDYYFIQEAYQLSNDLVSSGMLAVAGVYLAEKINRVLGNNWRKFSTQNYFDPSGLFLSVLWSGPLLMIAMIILINTLFSLCYLIVRWKRAELRHRARLNQSKKELNHGKQD